MVGVSLAVFGAYTRSVSRTCCWFYRLNILGEQRAIVVGILADGCGLLYWQSLRKAGWFGQLLLLLACGGITLPALQGIISVRVGQVAQGQLQGLLTSLTHPHGCNRSTYFAFCIVQPTNLGMVGCG